MSNIAIINDNNNFALSIFWSLCEFVGDCFGPRYFSSGATLDAPSETYLGLKQSPPISHNDLKKGGVQLLLSNYFNFFNVLSKTTFCKTAKQNSLFFPSYVVFKLKLNNLEGLF